MAVTRITNVTYFTYYWTKWKPESTRVELACCGNRTRVISRERRWPNPLGQTATQTVEFEPGFCSGSCCNESYLRNRHSFITLCLTFSWASEMAHVIWLSQLNLAKFILVYTLISPIVWLSQLNLAVSSWSTLSIVYCLAKLRCFVDGSFQQATCASSFKRDLRGLIVSNSWASRCFEPSEICPSTCKTDPANRALQICYSSCTSSVTCPTPSKKIVRHNVVHSYMTVVILCYLRKKLFIVYNRV